MGIIVDHEKRKKEILQKALDVFVKEGFEDATFQKIADKCGITRTTLYIYFKNKREIFLWSIKQLTYELELALKSIIGNDEFSAPERLLKMLTSIVDSCVENRKLFTVVLAYLIQVHKTGKKPHDRVKRRIIRLRHLLSTILIEGKNNGEFKDIDVKAANEMFYALIESVIFRLAVFDQKTVTEIMPSVALAVQSIAV